MKGWVINFVVASAVIAILFPSAATLYSAYVSSSNHHTSCGRIDHLADAVQNILTLATTPAKGQTYSAGQVAAANAFSAQSAAFLNQARC